MPLLGSGQGTLYPLGDSQFFGSFSQGFSQYPAPQVTFAPDNSNVDIEWYFGAGETCDSTTYTDFRFIGTLPRAGSDTYVGQLNFDQCQKNGWAHITTVSATFNAIDNPV